MSENLFCKEQKSYSEQGRKNFDRIFKVSSKQEKVVDIFNHVPAYIYNFISTLKLKGE